jgi:hypothetical protein
MRRGVTVTVQRISFSFISKNLSKMYPSLLILYVEHALRVQVSGSNVK